MADADAVLAALAALATSRELSPAQAARLAALAALAAPRPASAARRVHFDAASTSAQAGDDDDHDATSITAVTGVPSRSRQSSASARAGVLKRAAPHARAPSSEHFAAPSAAAAPPPSTLPRVDEADDSVSVDVVRDDGAGTSDSGSDSDEPAPSTSARRAAAAAAAAAATAEDGADEPDGGLLAPSRATLDQSGVETASVTALATPASHRRNPHHRQRPDSAISLDGASMASLAGSIDVTSSPPAGTQHARLRGGLAPAPARPASDGSGGDADAGERLFELMSHDVGDADVTGDALARVFGSPFLSGSDSRAPGLFPRPSAAAASERAKALTREMVAATAAVTSKRGSGLSPHGSSSSTTTSTTATATAPAASDGNSGAAAGAHAAGGAAAASQQLASMRPRSDAAARPVSSPSAAYVGVQVDRESEAGGDESGSAVALASTCTSPPSEPSHSPILQGSAAVASHATFPRDGPADSSAALTHRDAASTAVALDRLSTRSIGGSAGSRSSTGSRNGSTGDVARRSRGALFIGDDDDGGQSTGSDAPDSSAASASIDDGGDEANGGASSAVVPSSSLLERRGQLTMPDDADAWSAAATRGGDAVGFPRRIVVPESSSGRASPAGHSHASVDVVGPSSPTGVRVRRGSSGIGTRPVTSSAWRGGSGGGSGGEGPASAHAQAQRSASLSPIALSCADEPTEPRSMAATSAGMRSREPTVAGGTADDAAAAPFRTTSVVSVDGSVASSAGGPSRQQQVRGGGGGADGDGDADGDAGSAVAVMDGAPGEPASPQRRQPIVVESSMLAAPAPHRAPSSGSRTTRSSETAASAHRSVQPQAAASVRPSTRSANSTVTAGSGDHGGLHASHSPPTATGSPRTALGARSAGAASSHRDAAATSILDAGGSVAAMSAGAAAASLAIEMPEQHLAADLGAPSSPPSAQLLALSQRAMAQGGGAEAAVRLRMSGAEPRLPTAADLVSETTTHVSGSAASSRHSLRAQAAVGEGSDGADDGSGRFMARAGMSATDASLPGDGSEDEGEGASDGGDMGPGFAVEGSSRGSMLAGDTGAAAGLRQAANDDDADSQAVEVGSTTAGGRDSVGWSGGARRPVVLSQRSLFGYSSVSFAPEAAMSIAPTAAAGTAAGAVPGGSNAFPPSRATVPSLGGADDDTVDAGSVGLYHHARDADATVVEQLVAEHARDIDAGDADLHEHRSASATATSHNGGAPTPPHLHDLDLLLGSPASMMRSPAITPPARDGGGLRMNVGRPARVSPLAVGSSSDAGASGSEHDGDEALWDGHPLDSHSDGADEDEAEYGVLLPTARSLESSPPSPAPSPSPTTTPQIAAAASHATGGRGLIARPGGDGHLPRATVVKQRSWPDGRLTGSGAAAMHASSAGHDTSGAAGVVRVQPRQHRSVSDPPAAMQSPTAASPLLSRDSAFRPRAGDSGTAARTVNRSYVLVAGAGAGAHGTVSRLRERGGDSGAMSVLSTAVSVGTRGSVDGGRARFGVSATSPSLRGSAALGAVAGLPHHGIGLPGSNAHATLERDASVIVQPSPSLRQWASSASAGSSSRAAALRELRRRLGRTDSQDEGMDMGDSDLADGLVWPEPEAEGEGEGDEAAADDVEGVDGAAAGDDDGGEGSDEGGETSDGADTDDGLLDEPPGSDDGEDDEDDGDAHAGQDEDDGLHARGDDELAVSDVDAADLRFRSAHGAYGTHLRGMSSASGAGSLGDSEWSGGGGGGGGDRGAGDHGLDAGGSDGDGVDVYLHHLDNDSGGIAPGSGGGGRGHGWHGSDDGSRGLGRRDAGAPAFTYGSSAVSHVDEEADDVASGMLSRAGRDESRHGVWTNPRQLPTDSNDSFARALEYVRHRAARPSSTASDEAEMVRRLAELLTELAQAPATAPTEQVLPPEPWDEATGGGSQHAPDAAMRATALRRLDAAAPDAARHDIERERVPGVVFIREEAWAPEGESGGRWAMPAAASTQPAPTATVATQPPQSLAARALLRARQARETRRHGAPAATHSPPRQEQAPPTSSAWVMQDVDLTSAASGPGAPDALVGQGEAAPALTPLDSDAEAGIVLDDDDESDGDESGGSGDGLRAAYPTDNPAPGRGGGVPHSGGGSHDGVAGAEGTAVVRTPALGRPRHSAPAGLLAEQSVPASQSRSDQRHRHRPSFDPDTVLAMYETAKRYFARRGVSERPLTAKPRSRGSRMRAGGSPLAVQSSPMEMWVAQATASPPAPLSGGESADDDGLDDGHGMAARSRHGAAAAAGSTSGGTAGEDDDSLTDATAGIIEDDSAPSDQEQLLVNAYEAAKKAALQAKLHRPNTARLRRADTGGSGAAAAAARGMGLWRVTGPAAAMAAASPPHSRHGPRPGSALRRREVPEAGGSTSGTSGAPQRRPMREPVGHGLASDSDSSSVLPLPVGPMQVSPPPSDGRGAAAAPTAIGIGTPPSPVSAAAAGAVGGSSSNGSHRALSAGVVNTTAAAASSAARAGTAVRIGSASSAGDADTATRLHRDQSGRLVSGDAPPSASEFSRLLAAAIGGSSTALHGSTGASDSRDTASDGADDGGLRLRDVTAAAGGSSGGGGRRVASARHNEASSTQAGGGGGDAHGWSGMTHSGSHRRVWSASANLSGGGGGGDGGRTGAR